jgi:hypothetical protein
LVRLIVGAGGELEEESMGLADWETDREPED